MAEAVYVLCAVTALLCGVLLLRSYARTSQRLLLWAALCFLGLAVNNALVFVDLVLTPQLDLSVLRSAVAFFALALLVYGLVTEAT